MFIYIKYRSDLFTFVKRKLAEGAVAGVSAPAPCGHFKTMRSSHAYRMLEVSAYYELSMGWGRSSSSYRDGLYYNIFT